MDGPLSGTVTVPVPGGKKVHIKKLYVAGGVAVVGIAAVLWYRNRNASAAAAPVTDPSMATDPAGNVGTIDPATGYVEGSAEDLAALSTGTNTDTSGSGGGGGSDGSDGNTATQVAAGPPFSDNAAWDQWATSYLVTTLGKDPGQVAAALALYLSGGEVHNLTDRDIINEATAAAQRPPQTGPNGYPPAINFVGSVTGTGPSLGAPTGIVVTGETTNSTTVTFHAVPGAVSYQVHEAPGSRLAGEGASSPITITGRAPGTRGSFTINAIGSDGKPGSTASFIATTKPAPKKAAPIKAATPAAPVKK